MKRKYKIYLTLLIVALLLCACTPIVQQDIPTTAAEIAPFTEPPDMSSSSPTKTPSIQTDRPTPDAPAPIDESLQIIIFDVGQADCSLILTGEHAMLIDAGNTGQDSIILGYLQKYSVTRLDIIAATHPHADHIGVMSGVIRAMDSIGTLIMPDVIHTTKTFENLLDAIEEKDIAVSIPKPGDVLKLGQASIQVLAPSSGSYADLNNYSIVLRIEYGQAVFLFTGDAEDISENEQLAQGFDVSADVLKVGHHGSNSSSTQRYLDAVYPSYAVISCGRGNSYGHPHNNTLTTLAERGVTVYRTDENGTVIFTTDGNTITASMDHIAGASVNTTTEPGSTQENTVKYIGNINSKIFHLPTCGTLPAEKNRVYFSSREESINMDYRPCQRCKP